MAYTKRQKIRWWKEQRKSFNEMMNNTHIISKRCESCKDYKKFKDAMWNVHSKEFVRGVPFDAETPKACLSCKTYNEKMEEEPEEEDE